MSEPIVALRGYETQLGPLTIRRALPVRERRMIGPWCFLDRYGPVSFTDDRPMDVAPHPHIGIQTVSWLLEGEVVHDDSLGFNAVVRPGGVNVMTSGSGIAHAEQTPRANIGRLSGVQLWVALPDAHRNVAASFDHVPRVPVHEHRGGIVQEFAGANSPAPRYSEMIGADVEVHRGETIVLPLEASFEHGLFVLSGDAEVDGERVTVDRLYYLAPGRTEVSLQSAEGARLLLLGGPPFPEKILMWWNFVARTPEEIAAATADWEAGRRFGPVANYDGPRIEAPPLRKFAVPNPAS